MEVSEDIPEIIMIEGDLRSGKTVYMVSRIIKMCDKNDIINTNFHIKGFDNITIHRVPNINILLNMPNRSLLAFSEIYHLFDKRQSNKGKNVKFTQDIQQIGKKQYKFLCDCYKVNLLDFRFTEQITKVIHSWGTIEQIIKKNYLENINPIGIKLLNDNIDDENYKSIFLYEHGKYDSKNEQFISLNQFEIIDGRDYFGLYNTHEILNTQKIITNF